MMTQHEINLIERQLFLLERIARILERQNAETDGKKEQTNNHKDG